MALDHSGHRYRDNRDEDGSHQSLRGSEKDSPVSSVQTPKRRDKSRDADEKETSIGDRSKTRIWDPDPDRDRFSDGDRASCYSDDYDNGSPSDRSLTHCSRSQTPSPAPPKGVRAKKLPNSPFYKTGAAGRRGLPRAQRAGGPAQAQAQRGGGGGGGGRSNSKDSPPSKDLDLVTKRMLSARLLKINELRNALSELQLRTDELQKENRILRQLQARQEKALHRYDDTESEIGQLLARHAGEAAALRERLRRAQEGERASERQLRDSEERLRRSQAAVARLKKLADMRELAPRQELSHSLEEERARAQEGERRVKELERNIELSTSSYQRQLAAERKKTISAQDDVKALQEELGRLGNKLKEKERELDTMNIYANRLLKPSPKKDTDSGSKRKVPSRNSTKAVQTDDRTSSHDFPSPPPAVAEANAYSESSSGDYLTLKGDQRLRDTQDQLEQEQPRMRARERAQEEEEKGEKLQLEQKLNALEERAKRLRDDWEKEEEDMRRVLKNEGGEEEKQRGRVQGEVERWNQDALANQQPAGVDEEERRKKEQLLAKLREIDRRSQSPEGPALAGLTPSEAEAGLGKAGLGRRAVRAQVSSEDLAFGSYAPTIGRPAARSGLREDSSPEALGAFSLGGADRDNGKDRVLGKGASAADRKSSLLQQLFGTPPPPQSSQMDNQMLSNQMEPLGGPPTANGLRLLDCKAGVWAPGTPTAPARNIHVAESRPAVRAIPSFDDDIEELTL